MNCSKCGNVIGPGSTICSACGTPVSDMQPIDNNVQEENEEDVLVLGVPEVQLSSDTINEAKEESIQPMTEELPEPTPVEPVIPVSPVSEPTPVDPVTPVNPEPTSISMSSVEPMGQPMPDVNQNMDYQPSYVQNQVPTPKKSNALFYIIVVVLALAIIGALAYFLFFTGEPNNGGDATQNANNTTNPSGKENSGELETVATSKTTIGDYDYVLPNGYTYVGTDEYDILINKSDKVQATLLIAETSYEEAYASKDEVDIFEEFQGVTEEIYNGRKWLVFSMREEGYDYKIGFTALDNNNCIAFSVFNEGTSTYSTIFSDLGKMVDTAEYKGIAELSGNSEGYINLNEFIQNYKVKNMLIEDSQNIQN